jgi:hypothetical protein
MIVDGVCVGYFSCGYDEVPDRDNLRLDRFILLIVSEVSVHQEGESME